MEWSFYTLGRRDSTHKRPTLIISLTNLQLCPNKYNTNIFSWPLRQYIFDNSNDCGSVKFIIFQKVPFVISVFPNNLPKMSKKNASEVILTVDITCSKIPFEMF